MMMPLLTATNSVVGAPTPGAGRLSTHWASESCPIKVRHFRVHPSKTFIWVPSWMSSTCRDPPSNLTYPIPWTFSYVSGSNTVYGGLVLLIRSMGPCTDLNVPSSVLARFTTSASRVSAFSRDVDVSADGVSGTAWSPDLKGRRPRRQPRGLHPPPRKSSWSDRPPPPVSVQ